MDPRAVGMWDMATLSVTEPASWALDVDEAGPYGEVSFRLYICAHNLPYL